MPARNPSIRHAAAAVAVATRYGHPDLPELRRRLTAEQLADYVARKVAVSRLTAEECDRIVALLRPAEGASA